MNNFGLYVIITEPAHSPERIAETCVMHGVAMLQLRDRDSSDRKIYDTALRILSITRGSGTKFIMNDRPDLALLAGADGVHLGLVKRGLPFPGDFIFGLSTHNLEQVDAARSHEPDYIAFGPVYPTGAKKKPDPAVGTENLVRALSLAVTPLVAIGGINRSNIEPVLETGVRNMAMIRAVVQAEDLDEEIRFFAGLLS